MNRLERAIRYITPGYAAKRAEALLRLKAIETARAFYDGADVGRRGASIRRSGADAQAASARSLPRLRAGSHDLVRNNPHARRGLEAIVANVVGAGIIPRFKRGKETVTELEELGRETLDTTAIDANGVLNYAGEVALIANTVCESGAALVLRQFVRDGPFPVQFLVLEPDYLDPARDGLLPDGGRIVQGVEFDRFGRRRQYWLYPEHPGGQYLRNLRSIPVPASDVRHVYRIDRPGQVHGIPWLATVMLRIADFADFEDAQLMRQKIAACFAIFYTDAMGGTPPPADELEKVEPGMIHRLGTGSEVTFAQPPTVTGYKDYASVSLHALAAGLGISYEALTGDLTGVNFTSGRMGRQEFERNIDRWRWLTLIPQACAPMMDWWLEGAALMGFDVDGVTVQHTPPRREMISPEREVPAIERALESGQITLTQFTQETGRDIDEYLDEMEEERGQLRDRKIKLKWLSSSSGQPAPPPGRSGPDDDDDPDDPDDDSDDDAGDGDE